MAGSAALLKKRDDFRQRRAGTEDVRHAHLQEFRYVPFGNDAADENADML